MSKQRPAWAWVVGAGVLGGLAMPAWAADQKPAPAAAAAAAAADRSPTVELAATSVDGVKLTVPAAGRPTVIAFVRADQPQSHQALRQMQQVLKEAGQAQVLLVLSGDAAPQHARGLKESYNYPWPIVADGDYSISGKLNIHVWPTTVVVDGQGRRVAVQPGLSKQYASNLEAYVEFAAGRIDEGGLARKLTTHQVVGDSADQAASRHLQVARTMLEKGRVDPARTELLAAAKLAPKEPSVRWTLAKLLVDVNRPAEALALLEGLPPGTAPAWEMDLVRAKALIERGGEGGGDGGAAAKELLERVVRASPRLPEAHYLLGILHERARDYARSSESYRRAYELQLTKSATTPMPVAPPPATRPAAP